MPEQVDKVRRLICDRCGEEATPNPDLAEKQGQRVDLVLSAITQEMVLCERCIKPLLEYLHIGQRRVQGCVPVGDSLPYMPRLD